MDLRNCEGCYLTFVAVTTWEERNEMGSKSKKSAVAGAGAPKEDGAKLPKRQHPKGYKGYVEPNLSLQHIPEKC